MPAFLPSLKAIGHRLDVSNERRISAIWAGLLLPALSFVCLPLKLVGAPAASSELVYSFITNFPAFRSLTVEVSYFSTGSAMMELRHYNSPRGRSIYGCLLTQGDTNSPHGFTSERAGYARGNWMDEFWSLAPAPSGAKGRASRPRFSVETANDLNRARLMHGNEFGWILGRFASLGISADPIDSLRVEGGVVKSSKPDESDMAIEAAFTFSNGLPARCLVQYKVRGVNDPKPIHIRYDYVETNRFPAPIPNVISAWARAPLPGQPEDSDPTIDGVDRILLRIKVVAAELAEPGEELTRDLFLPNEGTLRRALKPRGWSQDASSPQRR